MSFTNLITIAIPCYERKEYFLFALESALNQTVKCKVIVVDNCSSHDLFKKVSKEKEVTYYRNETNIGLYPNYNMCYSLATTEYVKILDDDDLLSPIYVESFLKAKKLHPDIDIFFSDYLILTSSGELPHGFTVPFGYMENGFKIIEFGIRYSIGFPYMSCAIRKTKALLDLDINGCIGGYDWEWIYSKTDQLSFYGDLAKMYKFRIHEKQTSRSKDFIAHILTAPYIYDKILPEMISDPKLIKKAVKKASLNLIYLKSLDKKGEFRKILNEDNRYGKYLKSKLDENIFLRVVFMLPAELIRNILFFVKMINRFWRRIHLLYK